MWILEASYTLKPRDFRRPRPLSNLRPFDWVNGFLCLCGPMPKCFTDSREVLLPLNKTVFEPVGALKASWSKVKASPPALRMRSFAAVVKRRAAIVSLGISVIRISSVTVPTCTIILDERSGTLCVSFVIRDRERGGRLILERNSRWRMTLLKLASVRRAKKR